MNGSAVHQNSSPSKRLDGKVAIVTGGASGIGAKTVKLFHQQGAKVIIGDVQDKLGNSLCQALNYASSKVQEDVSFVHCDVSKEAEVKNLVDTAIQKYCKLDIMYSNAGIAGKLEPEIVGAEADSLRKILEVNLIGGFLGAKHAARVMIPAKKGSIIFTASIASVTSGLCTHAYTASKCALVGLMKSLCVELGNHGIRVNSVSPSSIPTPLLMDSLGVEKEIIEQVYDDTAVLKGAIAKEQDVAEAVLYFASDESRVITGQNIVIDGGYSTTNLAYNKRLVEIMATGN